MKYIKINMFLSSTEAIHPSLWTLTESYGDLDNQNTQFCFYECTTPEEADNLFKFMDNIKNDLDFSDNDDYFFFRSKQYLIASKNFLLNAFKGTETIIPADMNQAQSVIYYITKQTNSILKIILRKKPEVTYFENTNEENMNFLNDFLGTKKSSKKSTAKFVTEGIYYPSLFFTSTQRNHLSQILWLQAGIYNNKVMLTAYGCASSKQTEQLKNIILSEANEKNIKLNYDDLAIKGTILVVAQSFMNEIYGTFQKVDLLNFTERGFVDTHATNRSNCIKEIYGSWQAQKNHYTLTGSKRKLNEMNVNAPMLAQPVYITQEEYQLALARRLARKVFEKYPNFFRDHKTLYDKFFNGIVVNQPIPPDESGLMEAISESDIDGWMSSTPK